MQVLTCSWKFLKILYKENFLDFLSFVLKDIYIRQKKKSVDFFNKDFLLGVLEQFMTEIKHNAGVFSNLYTPWFSFFGRLLKISWNIYTVSIKY